MQSIVVLPRPTDAELAILRVMWQRGPSTVREVHEELAARRPIGYTTVLKLLQIMSAKGLVNRDERQRSHVYFPASSEEETQRQLLTDLLKKAFSGSTHKLFMQALSVNDATPEEVEAIRALLDRYQSEQTRCAAG